MEIIIPPNNDRVIYKENGQGIAICAYRRKDCIVNTENVMNLSQAQKENLFDAYVLFDTEKDKIIEKHNVFIDDYRVVAYVHISHLSDNNGNHLELCHYTVKTPIRTSWWEAHSKTIFSAIALYCVTVITIYSADKLWIKLTAPKEQIETKDSTATAKQNPPVWIPTIEFDNNLASKGYLVFSIPEGVTAKMYVSPNLKASNESINWNKVTTSITSNDTLYPKKDCKIFIHAYSNQAPESAYNDYEFAFSMKDFVQFVILRFTNDKELLSGIAKQLFYHVSEKRPITFDIGGGIEPTTITSIYGLQQIPDYMSQDVENFKIDSIGFYPYDTPQKKEATIFSKEYPGLKYIRLK